MPPIVIFTAFVLFGMLAAWLAVRAYLLPALAGRPLADQLRPLALFHGFRYIGLGFLAGPDVVGPIGAGLAWHLALGDLTTAILAMLAARALTGRSVAPPALALVWAFNLIGFFDLVLGIGRSMLMTANGSGMAGAGPWPYVIVGFYVPSLLVTHLVMFGMLLGGAGRRAPA